MKKIWTKYYGVILFYSVIIFGIIILNARFTYLNQEFYDKDTISFRGDVK